MKSNLKSIKLMNDANCEREQMNQFFGGVAGNGCTATTMTVHPNSPVTNDGDDSYQGECGVVKVDFPLYA